MTGFVRDGFGRKPFLGDFSSISSVSSAASSGKRNAHRPAPVRNFSSLKKGEHRGKISVVDMVSLVFKGHLYLPSAWKVFFFEARKVLQKIFFRWW